MPETPITVAAALALPTLRRGLPRVVAGEDGLDRPIRWVHAGEVPNIASLLRGGELLLTTGMGIGEHAADQRRFVADLAALDVAALAIELGHRYATRLPRALVAEAEKRGLPLVELHAEVPFVAVTEAIHTEIISQRYDVLRQVERLQSRFTTVMLEGGGIPAVLALLAATVGNPVFLEAADGRLLHAAPGEVPEDDAVAAWRRAAADDAAPGLAVPVPAAGARSAGRLVVLPLQAPLDAGTGALAVERAADAVALALLRTRQEDELAAHGRGQLLTDLAAGRLTPRRAADRAKTMGFTPRDARALLPIVAQLGVAGAAGLASRAAGQVHTLIRVRDLEARLADLGLPVLVGVEPRGDLVLMLVALPDAERRSAVAGRVAEAVRTATGGDDTAHGIVVAAAAGGWAVAPAGLRRAMDSAAAAAFLPLAPWHDATTMNLERLLWSWREEDALRAYVDDLLGVVLEHDARRKHQLLPTLEALCEHGGRKTDTARALHVNRQGLYDRVARLERLLGVDLSDMRVLLALHLAVRARRYTAPAPAG